MSRLTRNARRAGALLLAAMAMLPGCAALLPRDASVQQRLAALPLAGLPLSQPVTIRWNDHLVPWIEAETDTDLAMALGLVHGHLRGAQIAIMRMIARGRLAEMAGPLATEIDHAIRLLDLGRSGAEVERNWPPETRGFVEAFLTGLNHALRQGPRSREFGLLGLSPEPFTTQDLLAIGRLAGADITWFTLLSLLPERGQPGFAARWQRVLEAGAGTLTADQPDAPHAALGALVEAFSRAGSNSVAVAPAHSASGAALIANDPHLALNLPNLWLLAGMRSPSFHLVGLMVPGLPIVGLGRSEHLAWGGTNLRSASSDLFDLTRLPPEQITSGETRIRQRLWFSATRPVRNSPLGPVITDASVIPGRAGQVLALRWAGHAPTDEISAFLRAARATDAAGFRAAFTNYGVSPQNFLYVDRAGTIGRLTAATLPDRAGFPANDPVLDGADPAATAPWDRLRDARQLPWLENPPEGILASANENPRSWATDPPPIGVFFSDGDRLARLRALLLARPRLTVEDLIALQADTRAPRAGMIAAALLARLDALPGGPPEPAMLDRLRGWDGDYAAESPAALVFELMLRPIALGVAAAQGRTPEGGWNYITAFMLRELDALPAAQREALLRAAVAEAAPLAARWGSWGEVHRLRVAHWLVNLPVLGRAFVIDSFPVGGSRETPMKTGHGFVSGPHEVGFGSMARHISDMADLDANWFVLFGGQDGWLGSAAFSDQVALWRERRSIRLPLRPATVAAEFPHVTRLAPRR